MWPIRDHNKTAETAVNSRFFRFFHFCCFSGFFCSFRSARDPVIRKYNKTTKQKSQEKPPITSGQVRAAGSNRKVNSPSLLPFSFNPILLLLLLLLLHLLKGQWVLLLHHSPIQHRFQCVFCAQRLTFQPGPHHNRSQLSPLWPFQTIPFNPFKFRVISKNAVFSYLSEARVESCSIKAALLLQKEEMFQMEDFFFFFFFFFFAFFWRLFGKRGHRHVQFRMVASFFFRRGINHCSNLSAINNQNESHIQP